MKSEALNKKPLESRQNGKPDVLQHFTQHEANLQVLCRSLVERYKRGNLEVHVHLPSPTLRTVNYGQRSNLCISLYAGKIEAAESLPINDLKFDVTGTPVKMGEQDVSVLVNVAEIVNDPKRRFIKVLPKVVRLQTLDFCHRIRGYPSKSVSLTELKIETFQRATNGEHVIFSGLVLRSKHKFPYQIIEGRPQVLKAVAYDDRQASGNGAASLESSDILIRVALCLSHHLAWISAEIPAKFGCEFCEVHFAPEDFPQDGIG